MDRYVRLVTGHPIAVLAAVAALTLLAVTRIVDVRSGAPRLLLDPSINALLPDDDEGRRYYEHVRRLFGSDDTVVVALVHEESIFTPEALRAVQRITERFEALDGVHHVLSLGNALDIRAAEGDLRIEPFLENLGADAASVETIRERALDNPIYAGNLVSPDGRATALVVHLLEMDERTFIASGIDERVRAIAEEETPADVAVRVTGGAHIKAETSRVLRSDLARIVPLAFLVISLVAFLAFRSLRGVLLPALSILIALLWTLGIAAVTRGSLNLVTVVIPPLILVVGFAYTVHVLADYYDAVRDGNLDDPVGAALRHVTLPVVLTGITTGVGFLSLTTSNLPAIREFGLFSAVGVLATMLTALSFAPATLQLLPAPQRVRRRQRGGRLDAFFTELARFVLRRRGLVLYAGAGVAVLALVGLSRIQISTDLVSNFAPDHRVRADYEAINRDLQGAGALYVVLETDYADAFREPANLRVVESLQNWLAAQPEVGGSTSLVDYLLLINRGFHDNDPRYRRIPESRRLVTQLLFFGANDEVERFADSRYQRVSVLVRSRAVDSGEVAALVDRIEERLAELPSHIRGRVTGNSVLVAGTLDDIAASQALSLSFAFVVIYAILALLFWSFRVGFIALLPNVLPVLFYFGLLGLTGITLNVTTSLVACLVLGIAVDDTIHYLARFNATAKLAADEATGVIEAMRGVGPPVTFTSVGLVAGFLVLTTATLKNQADFGALAAATLAFAWLADVTFTPALAARMRIVTLWDVLTLDLGESPQQSIPLFRGLSKTQARVAALMTRIVTFPKGHKLFRVGDAGDEMYVVIDGRLAATRPSGAGPVQLSEHARGDVVGEVALFHGRRTADVETQTDVRLLRITQRTLERLQRRYPRIGTQLYRNLSQILAERLVRATERVRG